MTFTISSPYLPTSLDTVPANYGAPFFTLLSSPTATAPQGAPIVQIDLTPATPDDGREDSITTATGTLTGNTYTVTPSAGTIAVYAVTTSGGTAFTPAKDITAPQPGEFVYDPYENELTLTTGGTYTVANNQTITIIGATRTALAPIINPVPPFATQVPLVQLEWGLDLEAHPSGSLTLYATRETLPYIKSRLRHGTEFSLYGIGFRTGQMSIAQGKESALLGGDFQVSIPLEGKWENYVDEPYAWRSLGLANAAQTDADVADETVPSSITLAELASAVGAIYQGPAADIPTPTDVRAGESTTFAQQLAEYTRVNGAAADWSSADAIRMRQLGNGRVWDYRGAIIAQDDISQDWGEPKLAQPFTPDPLLLPATLGTIGATISPAPTPELTEEPSVGVAIEWENVQLTGKFSEPLAEGDGEDTASNSQGRVSWVPRVREVKYSEDGDPDPDQPPIGAVRVRDVSLNFDQSGPTKTRIRTRKEDGVATLIETWKYGYAFTSYEARDGDGQINGIPSALWKLIEYTRQESIFDERTLYYLGYNKTGWRLGRYKQETATNPETKDISGDEATTADSINSGGTNPDEAAAANPTQQYPYYAFRQLPIIERERVLLRQHRDFYKLQNDAEARGEVVKITLPSGEEVYQFLKNPNYVQSMFVAATARESCAFCHIANPDGENLPPLIGGKEEGSRDRLTPDPGRLMRLRFGANNKEQPGDRTPDRYSGYSVKFTSQDGQFSNSLEDAKVQDYEGQPGVAERLPPLFERQEPAEGDGAGGGTEQGSEEADKLYLLNSGTPTAHLGEAKNYPNAITLDEALTAARTDAQLEQWESGIRESITVGWNPEIRPGDRFIYMANGEIRRRVVTGCQWKPRWQGMGVDGVHRAIGFVELELARDVDAGAALTLTVIDLPGEDQTEDGTGEDDDGVLTDVQIVRRGFSLGEILPRSVVSRTRGNY